MNYDVYAFYDVNAFITRQKFIKLCRVYPFKSNLIRNKMY